MDRRPELKKVRRERKRPGEQNCSNEHEQSKVQKLLEGWAPRQRESPNRRVVWGRRRRSAEISGTKTIDTNLRQGDLETEVATETEGNEAMSEWKNC